MFNSAAKVAAQRLDGETLKRFLPLVWVAQFVNGSEVIIALTSSSIRDYGTLCLILSNRP